MPLSEVCTAASWEISPCSISLTPVIKYGGHLLTPSFSPKQCLVTHGIETYIIQVIVTTTGNMLIQNES